jgi:hypothetical protein
MVFHICKQLDLPLDTEIHYHYPSNGIDSHISLKYKENVPFNDYETHQVENYIKLQFGDDTYKHKQVIKQNGATISTNTCYPALTNDIVLKYLTPGYSPPPFSDYTHENTVFHFPTISMLLLDSKGQGDTYRALPTNNDIVIDKSDSPSDRISVTAFLCDEKYPLANTNKQRIVKSSNDILPWFGISVIFS